jgi:hypothetical protein
MGVEVFLRYPEIIEMAQKRVNTVSREQISSLYRDHGPLGLINALSAGVEGGKIDMNYFSFRELAAGMGCLKDPFTGIESYERIPAILSARLNTESIDPVNGMGPVVAAQRLHQQWQNESKGSAQQAYYESGMGLNAAAFQIVTGELIGAYIIKAYDSDYGYIGDDLVSKLRNMRMAGFTHVGAPLTVKERMPYEETTFTEKYITTNESKKGRILAIDAELIQFDQTGEIMRRANILASEIRREREETIVRGVQDADSGSSVYVWRPSGTGAALYNTSNANLNYIGTGGSTGYSTNTALRDWTNLQMVKAFRASLVTDDRIDGTQKPIMMIPNQTVLLVPEALSGRANQIVNATSTKYAGATTSAWDANEGPNPAASWVGGGVKSSPYVDLVSGVNWYYGDFKSQFLWTEIWPIQTFTQGADSEDAFNRDIVMKIKVRYYGGISAVDTRYVTQVIGA